MVQLFALKKPPKWLQNIYKTKCVLNKSEKTSAHKHNSLEEQLTITA